MPTGELLGGGGARRRRGYRLCLGYRRWLKPAKERIGILLLGGNLNNL
jgi:hypothetical protein